MEFATTDLCDAHESSVQVAEPIFLDFGGRERFAGPIATLDVFEDNVLVRAALESPGEGRILVVNGGGSTQKALVGDTLAGIGADNGWAGIVIYGAVRDTAQTRHIDIGLRALAACPRRPAKEGFGQRDEPVNFAGVTFHPSDWLYADADGIVVSSHAIH